MALEEEGRWSAGRGGDESVETSSALPFRDMESLTREPDGPDGGEIREMLCSGHEAGESLDLVDLARGRGLCYRLDLHRCNFAR